MYLRCLEQVARASRVNGFGLKRRQEMRLQMGAGGVQAGVSSAAALWDLACRINRLVLIWTSSPARARPEADIAGAHGNELNHDPEVPWMRDARRIRAIYRQAQLIGQC